MSKYGVFRRYSITVLQFLKTVFSARNMDFLGFLAGKYAATPSF